MSLANLYSTTCTIQEVSYVEDGLGGGTDVPSTLEANVPCRIRPMTAREREVCGGLDVDATHRVYLNVTSLDEKNRLVDAAGTEYEVRGVRIIASGSPHHMEVDVLERRDGGT